MSGVHGTQYVLDSGKSILSYLIELRLSGSLRNSPEFHSKQFCQHSAMRTAHDHLDELERACAEQGARIASLKRDAGEKESIDAAVSQLLEQKLVLKVALEEMIHTAEASGDVMGLPVLQERLAPLLPKGKGKKKATCVPPAPPPPQLPSSLDRAAEWETFVTVRKNRDACIHWVLRLAQAAEREWDDAPLRHARLELLRDCLESLREHAHADCRELGGLAPRMLQSLDFELRHLTNLVLFVERRHSKGLRDDQLLPHLLVTSQDDVPAARAAGAAGAASAAGAAGAAGTAGAADGHKVRVCSRWPIPNLIPELKPCPDGLEAACPDGLA